MNPILKYPAIELAKLIRQKQLTSEEVVKTFISQIKKVNSDINAVVADRFDLALKEAKEVDEKIKAGLDQDLPLLGVPCTIKEMLSLKNMPLTVGLVSRKGQIAHEDGTAVARLKKAGAIPLGVTNIPVVGLFYETRNNVYGRTNNPHNLDHIPGGSSGGEGAIVAAAGSPFGIGSDIGGSIRLPAGFCGIFGHKPSAGLVPSTGHYPYAPERIARQYLGIGPLTRSSKDLMPLLKIIAGPDEDDNSCEQMKIGNPDEVDITKLNIYWIDHTHLHPDVAKAQKNTIDQLKSLGANIKQIDLGKFKYAYEMFDASLIKALPDALYAIGDGQEMQPGREFLKKLAGHSDYPWYTILIAMGGKMERDLTPSRVEKYFNMGEEFRNEFNEMLGDNGVLIYPTHPYPAVKHGHGLTHIMRVAFTGIFNILQAPSTAFPTGLSDEGLPLSMQAVAKRGNDHLTIAIAQSLEKIGDTWLVPDLAR